MTLQSLKSIAVAASVALFLTLPAAPAEARWHGGVYVGVGPGYVGYPGYYPYAVAYPYPYAYAAPYPYPYYPPAPVAYAPPGYAAAPPYAPPPAYSPYAR